MCATGVEAACDLDVAIVDLLRENVRRCDFNRWFPSAVDEYGDLAEQARSGAGDGAEPFSKEDVLKVWVLDVKLEIILYRDPVLCVKNRRGFIIYLPAGERESQWTG